MSYSPSWLCYHPPGFFFSLCRPHSLRSSGGASNSNPNSSERRGGGGPLLYSMGASFPLSSSFHHRRPTSDCCGGGEREEKAPSGHERGGQGSKGPQKRFPLSSCALPSHPDVSSNPPLAFSSACNGKKRRETEEGPFGISSFAASLHTSSNRGRGRSNEERKLLEREAGVRLTDWGSLSSRFRRGQGLRASARQRNQYGSGGKSAVRKSLEEEGS